METLQQLGAVVAPSQTARQFAVERPLRAPAGAGEAEAPEEGEGVPTVPCGLHKAYNYLRPGHLTAILAQLEAHYSRLLERQEEEAARAVQVE